MLIKEIMNTGVIECTEDTSLKDTYELIQRSPAGFVVVIDSIQHRVPIGIVNEHSICESVVRRSRHTKDLDAGNVMSTNIKRVSENTQISDCSFTVSSQAILVVNEKRQFLGTVDPAELDRSMATMPKPVERPGVFASMLGGHVPAAVEIPAFGWLK